MASKQANIIQTIIQIAAEASRVAIEAMAMANAENNQRSQNVETKLDRPIMRQLTFFVELHRKVWRTEELQNGGKSYASKV